MGIKAKLQNFETALYYLNQSLRRRIRWVMIYATNRCNARCVHCKIWEQNPKVDLSPEVIEGIVDAECTNSSHYHTSYGLEGGEFLLHPRFREILDLVKDREYILLSNGFLDDLLIDVVYEFEVENLHVSLDGGKETHALIRGIDIFDKIDHIVNELRARTDITLVYSATPWNSYKDFLFVKNYCKERGIGFAVSVFANFSLFDVEDMFKRETNVLQGYDLRDETDPYLLCYQDWLQGRARIPCQSIGGRIVVYPNGDLPLCCHKKITLGNLYEQSLDEIWSSGETKRIQKQFLGSCNDCWISFHKNYDFFYINTLNRCFPEFLTRKILGDFSNQCALCVF